MDAEEADHRAQKSEMLTYLKEMKFPSDLRNRVNVYFEYIWSTQHGIDPQDVLDMLSGPLRTDVLRVICQDMVDSFLVRVGLNQNGCPMFANSLISRLEIVGYPEGEYIFKTRDVGRAMYFIRTGLLDIYPPLYNEPLKTIGKGSSFGEGAFFSGVRSASIKTASAAELMKLSKESFFEVAEMYPALVEAIQFQAFERNKTMNKKNAEEVRRATKKY
jgi:CRP-like cAMP-binding protein